MHPYLATLGMCFNTFLGLVICLECGSAISSKNIESHLHNIHKDHRIRIEHIKLTKALSDLQATDSFDLITLPSTCPQIEGLKLCRDAYLCTSCQHIRGTLASIKKHHLVAHSHCPMPTLWTRVAAQQIYHQNHTPYFQVIPRHVPTQNDNATMRFFNSLNLDRQKVVADFDISKIDPRQVSIWLNATKWHILVAPYDYNHLLSLVQMPSKSEPELEILAKAVDAYTRKADQAMDSLSHLALCILNSPEPP
jgi:hypothetical protein